MQDTLHALKFMLRTIEAQQRFIILIINVDEFLRVGEMLKTFYLNICRNKTGLLLLHHGWIILHVFIFSEKLLVFNYILMGLWEIAGGGDQTY